MLEGKKEDGAGDRWSLAGLVTMTTRPRSTGDDDDDALSPLGQRSFFAALWGRYRYFGVFLYAVASLQYSLVNGV